MSTLAIICAPTAATIFLGLAGLHAYWALGGFWPGTDADSLNRTVVGGRSGMRGPGPIATWLVTAILLGAAVTVLGGSGVLTLPMPRAWLRLAAQVGAALLGLRGLEGFIDSRLRPETVGSPFARLNTRIYSPLCLVLAICTTLAVAA